MMQAYENYKNSVIPWLDKIPAHWKHFRLANTGVFSKGRGISRADLEESGYPAILYGDIYTKYSISTSSLLQRISPPTAEQAVSIYSGDLLFTASGETKEDIGRCVCYVGEETAYAGGDVIIYRQQMNNSVFLSYLFNSCFLDQQKAMLAKGNIIVHIYSSQLRNILFPLPPLAEQTKIVTYLDQETIRIDRLITAKERLLKILEEKRKALVLQAVTRGLGGEAGLRDSGVDWLGWVPEHWGVKRIKDIAVKVGSGVTPSGGATSYEKEGIPFLRSQNVHFDGLRLDDVAYISEDTHQKMSNSQVRPGDVLLNITGASIGRTFYVEDSLPTSNVNQHVCVLRADTNIDYRYLHLLLLSDLGQEQVKMEFTGGGREGLTFEAIKNFRFPLPDIKEQRQILDFYEKESETLKIISDRTIRTISLLNERFSSLISAAVTGAIEIPEV